MFSIFPIFEWIISKLNKNIIFDFDDAIWIYNKYLPKIIKLSRHVIVGNSFLKNYALKYNKNVTKIPLPIDIKRYKVKKFRNKKGWSQERLSREADISYQTLIKIEQNRVKNPKLQTLIKIANALDVTLDELVSSSI